MTIRVKSENLIYMLDKKETNLILVLNMKTPTTNLETLNTYFGN